MSLDGLELRLLEPAMEIQPAGDLAQGALLEFQQMRPPTNGSAHDAGLLEHLEVLRHGRLRDAEPGRRLAHACRSGYEPFDDCSSCRMGERIEAAIEFRLIIHLEVYNSQESLSWPVDQIVQRRGIFIRPRDPGRF